MAYGQASDVGYLTEYFRKQENVLRSDHATHSVAARGRLAHALTFEHGARGPHMSPFGEYAFSDSSPWAKMYAQNAKIVFVGVTMMYNTMKHLVEGRYVEWVLAQIPDEEKRRQMAARVKRFGSEEGVWPTTTAKECRPGWRKRDFCVRPGAETPCFCVSRQRLRLTSRWSF